MDIKFLVNVTSRAWSIPILAAIHDGTPGRQAPLLAATKASRTAFGQSLQHLIDIGLLERNPGHGHPLRPEFRLTETGKRVAPMAQKILSVTPQEDHQMLRRSWSIPILSRLGSPSHFKALRIALPQITDRALSLSLQNLEHSAYIERRVDPFGRPPRPQYAAINTGLLIGQIAQSDLRTAPDGPISGTC